MSDEWGRMPFLELDGEALTRLLQPTFPGARVTASCPMSGGHVNTNYRVEVSGRAHAYVVRLHARGAAVAEKERAILRLVARRVPVPEVIWTGVADMPGAPPLTVLRWVEGQPMHEVLASGSDEDAEQCAAAAGAALPAIGSFAFRQSGFLGPDLAVDEPMGPLGQGVRSFVEFSLFKGPARERVPEEMKSRLWTFAMRYCHRLNGLREKACLGHADYHGGNIVMSRSGGGWRVAAVVDWEFAWSGSPIIDVGIFLRRTARRFPAAQAPFLAAYAAAGGEFPPDGLTLARTADLVNLLTFLNREDCSEALQSDVLATLEETLQSIRRP
ncbi:MAG TPA: aminoglycoside phosphotransferase family protein [Armatimonadota bacterium]|jgi:aminoglycoside phosphotransferase (APT) family kinase protein